MLSYYVNNVCQSYNFSGIQPLCLLGGAETGRSAAREAVPYVTVEVSESDRLTGGTLYIVSTPIGNLSDITYRAVTVLQMVNVVLAEDTRQTRKLTTVYHIQTPLLSYTPFNQRDRIPQVLARLAAGETAALVTDSGTPAVSDPGSMLIKSVIDAGFAVSPVPGASALLAGLVSAGFNTDQFVFEGFLPVKKGRKTRIDALAAESRTVVLYESPHRLLKLLNELESVLNDRRIAVARELTKKFEEVKRGTVSEVKCWFEQHAPRGEFVVIIGQMESQG